MVGLGAGWLFVRRGLVVKPERGDGYSHDGRILVYA